jgi:hypothetical protein
MGRSLKSAKGILDCLRSTRWDLFSAVAQISDQRKTEADLLMQDISGWLKLDEQALAGGLASKLSEAEGRAIRLLTPPKIVDPIPKLPEIDLPRPTTGWRQVGSAKKERLRNAEAISETKSLLEKLEQNPKLRLTVQWNLEEESP